MERVSGGSFVAGKLKELETALVDFFGALNQVKEGMHVTIPDKPEVLEKLEQCESLGIPLIHGGLMDQPHIFLLEVGVVRNVRETFAVTEEIQQQ